MICVGGKMLAVIRIVIISLLGFILATNAHAQSAVPTKVIAEDPAIPYPVPNYGNGAQKALIQRGEYLAKAGDCIACHTDTAHKGKPFGGGYGIKTPFGLIYSPNLTADKETGIGNWTDEDFVRAMHDGISPSGSNYYPAFPFTSFTRVSKDDLLAIKAYLFSIPTVHHPKQENLMGFPFSVRFLQWGWKIMFFYPHSGLYKEDASKSAEWNRGAYLVQGLAHCGECHSPRNALGGIKYRYNLTGSFVDNYYAPDITKKGIEGLPTQEVVNVFIKDEKLRGAGKVGGPMLDVNHNSLRYLTQADLTSIVTYLQTVESDHPKTHTGPVTAETGQNIYDTYCAACHEKGGAGAPITGDKTAWDPRLKQGMATVDTHAISGFNSMPPKGACTTCTNEEIRAAVTYMLDQLKSGKAIKSSTAPVVLTLAQGKAVYEKNCASCHAQGKYGSPRVGDKKTWAPLLEYGLDTPIYKTIHGDHPAIQQVCSGCSVPEIIAAVKYMATESSNNDYSLW